MSDFAFHKGKTSDNVVTHPKFAKRRVPQPTHDEDPVYPEDLRKADRIFGHMKD